MLGDQIVSSASAVGEICDKIRRARSHKDAAMTSAAAQPLLERAPARAGHVTWSGSIIQSVQRALRREPELRTAHHGGVAHAACRAPIARLEFADETRLVAVNDYSVRERLGCGSFSTVWSAVDGTGRLVALKEIDPKLLRKKRLSSGDADAATDAIGEVEIWRRLSHRNVVMLFKTIQDADASRVFHVMEMMRGGTPLEESNLPAGLDYLPEATPPPPTPPPPSPPRTPPTPRLPSRRRRARVSSSANSSRHSATSIPSASHTATSSQPTSSTTPARRGRACALRRVTAPTHHALIHRSYRRCVAASAAHANAAYPRPTQPCKRAVEPPLMATWWTTRSS